MIKMLQHSIVTFLFIGILLLQFITFIPYSYSANFSSLKEKMNLVQQILREQRQSGEPLPSEVTEELQKARKARMEKDWVSLEESLDRIIEYLSKDYKENKLDLASGEGNILGGAKERIEQYRMAPARLNFVSENGQPVTNAAVKIEQTTHEFLFGCNRNIAMQMAIFSRKYGNQMPGRLRKKISISDQQIEDYMQKFLKFANYTQIGVNWYIYEHRPGEIVYSIYDKEINWLHEKGLKLRAGHLVWNFNTPGWVPENCNQMINTVRKRVKDFISHYKGKIDFFSVINEVANPFRPQLNKDKMTKCIREIGKISFASFPLKTARELDPTAKLVINEVSILEQQGFPDLLKNLKDSDDKPLYDVIGIQSHMHKQIWPLDKVWEICELYSGFGVPLQFTEVTALSGTPTSGKGYGRVTTTEGERQQAEYVVKFYTLLFSHPAVEAIQWWNLTDLGALRGAPGGLLRKDMSPKPAYHALIDLIWEKWWTKVETTTSEKGQCQYKGFFGDYRVTVSANPGEAKTFNIKLSKKGKRDFRLVL